MNDISTTPNVLDPDRPWITDERQLPSRMSWIGSLFNPTGKSPKLHFTRVWTVCFFLQFLIVVIPFGLGIVIGLAGGDPSGIKTFGLYASPVVFIATTIISFVAHSRRLNDAGKLSLWAVLVLIPLLIGMALFMSGVMQKSAEYDEIYKRRAEYLAEPNAWRARRQIAQTIIQDKTTKLRDVNERTRDLFSEVLAARNPLMTKNPSAWQTRTLSKYEMLSAESRLAIGDDAQYHDINLEIRQQTWGAYLGEGAVEPSGRDERLSDLIDLQERAKTMVDTSKRFYDLNSEIRGLIQDVFYLRDIDQFADSEAWRASKQADFDRIGPQAKIEAKLYIDSQYHGPRADLPLPDQVEFILKPSVGIIQMVLFGMNLLIMIWSLMWVARVPDFGKAKREEDEPVASAGQAVGAFD